MSIKIIDEERIRVKNVSRHIRTLGFIEGMRYNGEWDNAVWYDEDCKETGMYSLAQKEAVSHEFEYAGGQIIFPTEVNAIFGDKKGFSQKVKNDVWFKSKWKSFLNRLKLKGGGKLDKLLGKYDKLQGWTVGFSFKGRYYDRKNNKEYDERSLTITFAGISSELLVQIATVIAREFEQNEVLVFDRNKNL